MHLTDSFLRTLKPAEKNEKYFDGGDMFLLSKSNGS